MQFINVMNMLRYQMRKIWILGNIVTKKSDQKSFIIIIIHQRYCTVIIINFNSHLNRLFTHWMKNDTCFILVVIVIWCIADSVYDKLAHRSLCPTDIEKISVNIIRCVDIDKIRKKYAFAHTNDRTKRKKYFY